MYRSLIAIATALLLATGCAPMAADSEKLTERSGPTGIQFRSLHGLRPEPVLGPGVPGFRKRLPPDGGKARPAANGYRHNRSLCGVAQPY